VAIDTTKVAVALSGAISKAPLAATAPTDSTTVLAAAFVDSGAISADGVTLAMPGAGDVTPVKAWQGGLTVRTLRTTSAVATLPCSLITSSRITIPRSPRICASAG